MRRIAGGFELGSMTESATLQCKDMLKIDQWLALIFMIFKRFVGVTSRGCPR